MKFAVSIITDVRDQKNIKHGHKTHHSNGGHSLDISSGWSASFLSLPAARRITRGYSTLPFCAKLLAVIANLEIIFVSRFDLGLPPKKKHLFGLCCKTIQRQN